MSMCEIIMRLSKGQLDKILADDDYFWTLTNQWRDTDHCFDIDKTWQAIHYVFNWSEQGGSPPAKWIVYGDRPVPALDGGYGPARYLTPSQVAKVNELIESISIEELKRRYNSKRMRSADIYPPIIWDESEWEYFYFHYQHLKTLYQKAASSGECMIMVIF